MQNIFKLNSLKNKVILYFILVVFIPLVISTAFILFEFYYSKLNYVLDKHKIVLAQTNKKTDEIIDNVENIAQYVKKHYSSSDISFLEQIIELEPIVSSILILNNEGTLLDFRSSSKLNIFKGYDYSNFELYKYVIKNEQPYWSNTYIRGNDYRITISYSIRLSKNHIAIFEIDLKQINILMEEFKNKDNSHMVRMIDNKFNFIVNPDFYNYVSQRKSILNSSMYNKYIKNNLYMNKQINFIGHHKKFDNIGVYNNHNRLKWIVIVRESKTDIFESFYNILYIILFSILLITIISIFIAIKLSSSIINPLKRFTTKIEKIAKCSYLDKKCIENNQYGEIQKLQNSFMLMQKEIENRENKLLIFNNRLEKEVEIKTQELVDINNSLELRVSKEVEKNLQNEKQIMESVKMAQMGEMIGNIAHQWRQPLSVISTSASGIKVKYEFGLLEDKDLPESMDSIVKSTKFLSKTIDTFRDYLKEKKEIKNILVQDRIKATINIVKASLKSYDIDIKENLDSIEDVYITMSTGELDQVIINIINNAKDVLVERDIEDRKIKLEISKNENYFIISIEDNGGGVPNDIKDKIFEPYFTTKHQSQGTGLGLNMSYKIITKSLKGKLYVINSDIGAKFFIEIPLDLNKEKIEN
ncbi:MAG: ATP-binding protein [Campylobacterota bacterium]|nr:ATP-binding protein [Campylobacterota bacterium]